MYAQRVRPDVAYGTGTAEICLPMHLRGVSLPSHVHSAEFSPSKKKTPAVR